MERKLSANRDCESILSIKNIGKRFYNKEILKGINVEIKKSTVTSIVGQNGAGKTTFLRIIIGLYEATSGTINYNVDKSKISMMLESDFLIEKKSGLDNIIHFCSYFEINYDSNFVEIISKKLNISSALDNKVITYSKGMKRKLSLLITLLRDSDLIILDEPTSGVDPVSRQDLRGVLNYLQSTGKTIIITSHDLAEVHKISNSVLMINDGKLINEFDSSVSFNDFETAYITAIREGVK